MVIGLSLITVNVRVVMIVFADPIGSFVERHLSIRVLALAFLVLIGFVLAPSIERNLWISMTRYGWSWLFEPGVLLIGAMTAVLTVLGVRVRREAHA